MNKQQESGFIILVAIGVLMGMLAIITSLVRFDQANQSDVSGPELDTMVDSIKQSVKRITLNDDQRGSYYEKPRIFKNWVVPGSLDYPVKLTLMSTFQSSDTTFFVKDLRKVFFLMATNRMYHSGEDRLLALELADDMNMQDTTFEIKYAGISDRCEDIDYLDSYCVIGNELMGLRSKSGQTYTVEKRGEHGGVVSHHSVGDPVWVIKNEDADNNGVIGYVKAINTWYRVRIERFRYDSSNHCELKIDFSDNFEDGLLSGRNHFEDLEAGTTIDFYPFNPGFANFDNEWNLNFVKKVIDENSKLNLNTLPGEVLDNRLLLMDEDSGGSDGYGDSNGLESIFPMQFTKELFLLGLGKESMDYVYNIHRDDLTVYSKPNYSTTRESFIFYTDKDVAAPLSDHSLVLGNASGNGYLQDNGAGSIRRIRSNTNENFILPHAINVNTASANVLTMFFEDIDAGGISEDQARALAVGIILYRSASEMPAFTTAALTWDLLERVNYNVEINPFDGTNDFYQNGTRCASSDVIKYGSAAEEFKEFLTYFSFLTGDTDNDRIEEIMSYARRDVKTISNLTAGSKRYLKNMLTFEAGAVKTIDFKMTASYKNEPVSEVNEVTVVEDFSMMDKNGYYLDSSSAEGNLVLNSINGWNEEMSIFYGVTFDQPTINRVSNASGNEIGFFIHVDKEQTFQTYPSLLSYKTNVLLEGVSEINNPWPITSVPRVDYYIDTPSVNLPVTTNFSEGSLDFGMRILGENDTFEADNLALNTSKGIRGNATSANIAIPQALLDALGFSQATWDNHAQTGGVVLTLEEFAVPNTHEYYAVDRVLVGAGGSSGNYIFQFTAGTTLTQPVGDITNLSDLFLQTVTDETYYRFSSLNGSVPGNDKPFYETNIYIPGATFTRVKWIDRQDTSGRHSVSAYVLATDGSYVSTSKLDTTDPDPSPGERYIFNASLATDHLRLRFEFDGSMNGVTNSGNFMPFPSPQLYEVIIDYETNDVPVQRKILARE